VININVGSISHCLLDRASFPLKNAHFPYPLSIQPRIWKCYPSARSLKFCIFRFKTQCVKNCYDLPFSHNTFVTDNDDRQIDDDAQTPHRAIDALQHSCSESKTQTWNLKTVKFKVSSVMAFCYAVVLKKTSLIEWYMLWLLWPANIFCLIFSTQPKTSALHVNLTDFDIASAVSLVRAWRGTVWTGMAYRHFFSQKGHTGMLCRPFFEI